MPGRMITNLGAVVVMKHQTDAIYARSASGLQLLDDSGNLGITVQDGGSVAIASSVFIGDTSNTFMDLGLTINQGSSTKEALALKATNVNHSFFITETDTYGIGKSIETGSGGLWLIGIKDGDGSFKSGMWLTGCLGEDADTTKSSAGRGVVETYSCQIGGDTLTADIVADGNIVVHRARVSDSDLSRWILGVDGSTWQSGGITCTTIEASDDVTLINADLYITATANSNFRLYLMNDEDDQASFYVARSGAANDGQLVITGNSAGIKINTSGVTSITGGDLSLEADAQLYFDGDSALNYIDYVSVGPYLRIVQDGGACIYIKMGTDVECGIGVTPGTGKMLRISQDQHHDATIYSVFVDQDTTHTTTGTYYQRGVYVSANTNHGVGIDNNGDLAGGYFQAFHTGAGDLHLLYATHLQFGLFTGGSGLVDQAYGLYIQPYLYDGTCTSMYGIMINTPSVSDGTSTVEYAIYSAWDTPSYFAGNIYTGGYFLSYEGSIVSQGGEGSSANFYLYADQADDNDDIWRIQADTVGNFHIASYSTGAYTNKLTIDGDGIVTINTEVSIAGDSLLLVSDNSPYLEARDTTNTVRTLLRSFNTSAFVGTYSNHDFTIRTNNTNALSFGTTQIATFASNVIIPATSILYFDGGTHTSISEYQADTLRAVVGGAATLYMGPRHCSINVTPASSRKLYINQDDTHDSSSCYGIYVDQDTTHTTTGQYYQRGILALCRTNHGVGVDNTGDLQAAYFQAFHTGAGTMDVIKGVGIQYGTYTDGSGTIDDVFGLYLSPYSHDGTTTNLYSIYISTVNVSGGTITNEWAIYSAQEAPSFLEGSLYIGAKNAFTNMTTGIGIYQESADDEAFAIGSGDVTHALTTYTDTTSYLTIQKSSAAAGGARIRVIAEDVALSNPYILQVFGGTADTTKTTSGVGLVDIQVYEHDGADNLANITADGNILSVRARVDNTLSTRLLLDEDGDLYIGSVLSSLGDNDTGVVWPTGDELHFYLGGSAIIKFYPSDGIVVNAGRLSFTASDDSGAVADQVSLGGYDIGAGNRVLAISQETAVAAETDETKFSHKMQVRINGATYYIMLCDS